MFVLGSSSRSQIGRVLPGAVTDRLLHGAPCPVAVAPQRLLVRGRRRAAAHGRRRVRRRARRPGRADGRDRARARGRRLSAAAGRHARHATSTSALVARDPAVRARAGAPPRRRGRAGARPMAVGEIPSTGEVLDGEPAAALAAASSYLDLLVCGSRGFGPLRTVMLGGTSHALVRRAACPVLVVPRGTEAAHVGRLALRSGRAAAALVLVVLGPDELGAHADHAGHGPDELRQDLGLGAPAHAAAELAPRRRRCRRPAWLSSRQSSCWSAMISRISVASSSSERANARTRSARVTIPTSRPRWTTGSRLIRAASIRSAAAVTGQCASTVIAGEVIAPATSRASKRRSASGSGRCRRRPTTPLPGLGLLALLAQQVGLGDHAHHAAVVVDDRHSGDAARRHLARRLLQRRLWPGGRDVGRHDFSDTHAGLLSVSQSVAIRRSGHDGGSSAPDSVEAPMTNAASPHTVQAP